MNNNISPAIPAILILLLILVIVFMILTSMTDPGILKKRVSKIKYILRFSDLKLILTIQE
jgi:hypothetical protein